MPVYLVTVPTEPPTEKLVEAANTASARNHVARQMITATVAKQPDLFRIAKAGGDIETAGQEPTQGGGLTELEELATTQTDDTHTEGSAADGNANAPGGENYTGPNMDNPSRAKSKK
jgi:hypothetical protein